MQTTKQPFIHLALPFGHSVSDMVRTRLHAFSDSITSVPQLVESFGAAGRIDNQENRQREVHMDENDPFPFDNILVGRHNYHQLVNRAQDKFSKGLGYPMLVIVRLDALYTPNRDSTKERFLCERSEGNFGEDGVHAVRPILVCKPEAEDTIFQAWRQKKTLLVASTPFINHNFNRVDQTIDIFLHIASADQVAEISRFHWDKSAIKKSGQYTMAADLIPQVA